MLPEMESPGFMVCDGRWKLLYGRAANAPSLDALYDFQTDPQELNSLIGANPDKAKHRRSRSFGKHPAYRRVLQGRQECLPHWLALEALTHVGPTLIYVVCCWLGGGA